MILPQRFCGTRKPKSIYCNIQSEYSTGHPLFATPFAAIALIFALSRPDFVILHDFIGLFLYNCYSLSLAFSLPAAYDHRQINRKEAYAMVYFKCVLCGDVDDLIFDGGSQVICSER